MCDERLRPAKEGRIPDAGSVRAEKPLERVDDRWPVSRLFVVDDCATYEPGHLLHWMAAKLAVPGEGQVGVVTATDDHRIWLSIPEENFGLLHHSVDAVDKLRAGDSAEWFAMQSVLRVTLSGGRDISVNAVPAEVGVRPCASRGVRLFGR